MKYIYSGLIAVVTLGLMFYDDLSAVKFKTSSVVASFVQIFIPGDDLREKIAELEAENKSLKAGTISRQGNLSEQVKVYSTYPFNGKKDISIAGGFDLDFKEGDAVVTGGGILVGQITEVSQGFSVVKTVYDSNWETSVRIGEKEIDGLFQGGLSPRVSFIKSDAEVKFGDLALSASPGLPYGLEIGKIKSLKESPGGPFKEAELEMGFSLNSLRNVSVYR